MTLDTEINDAIGATPERWALHVFFVVDCSGSMAGDKMASLNYAMRSALPALRAAATDHPANDTFVRVISFADTAIWMSEASLPIAQFNWRDLSAGGETSLGAGLEKLAAAMTTDAMPGRQLSPIIILMSDGLPTDNVDAGMAQLEASVHGGQAVRIAVAIGSDADMPSLQKFIGGSTMRPLRANSVESLISSIKWAASEPVAAVSQIVGGEKIASDALADKLDNGIQQQNKSDESFVW